MQSVNKKGVHLSTTLVEIPGRKLRDYRERIRHSLHPVSLRFLDSSSFRYSHGAHPYFCRLRFGYLVILCLAGVRQRRFSLLLKSSFVLYFIDVLPVGLFNFGTSFARALYLATDYPKAFCDLDHNSPSSSHGR